MIKSKLGLIEMILELTGVSKGTKKWSPRLTHTTVTFIGLSIDSLELSTLEVLEEVSRCLLEIVPTATV
jgi:hypothetical protein